MLASPRLACPGHRAYSGFAGPSLGRVNGDAGMTHLVFRVDEAQRAGCQSDRIKNALALLLVDIGRRQPGEPRRQHRMKTFPDRSSLPPWLAPAVRARPALHECLEGPHEENASQ